MPRELLALVAAFNQMLDRLETSFQQLSQVSADMAHDLRTPIANLLGQTEVALTQDRSLQYYETLLGSNFEELLRLSRMIDSMLFLAQAQQPRIFDRFYRVDASRHDSATGSGLGLSIVRSIMQLHHGHCAVESQNRLTRFTLFFPSPKAP